MCAVAVIVQPGQAITDTILRHLHGSCRRICIVASGGNIAELGLAIDHLAEHPSRCEREAAFLF